MQAGSNGVRNEHEAAKVTDITSERGSIPNARADSIEECAGNFTEIILRGMLKGK